MVFQYLARYVGVFGCFFELLLSLMAGIHILSHQPKDMLNQMQQQLKSGQDPKSFLMGSLRVFASGVLLIMPGILSDVYGIWLWVTSGAWRSVVSSKMTGGAPAESSNQFEQSWSGDQFGDKMDGKSKIRPSDIVDATIISTEEQDGDHGQQSASNSASWRDKS